MAEGTDDDEEVDKDHAGSDRSVLRHMLLTSVIIGGGFTIAYFVDNLQMGKWFALLLWKRTADIGDSAGVCGVDWVDDDIVHLAWVVLLEGTQWGM